MLGFGQQPDDSGGSARGADQNMSLDQGQQLLLPDDRLLGQDSEGIGEFLQDKPVQKSRKCF